MAKKKARPEFKLPSTEPVTGAVSSSWVYKSNDDAVDPGPVPETDRVARPVTTLGKAQRIVSNYSKYAAAAGLIPIPALDVVAIGGLQLKMVSDLATNYGLPFNENLGKSLIAALVGGVGATKIAYGFGGSLLKSIPLIGAIGGLIAMPGFACALTYAIGKVFVQHFEAGGTLLDFDPRKMRAYFQSEFESARA